MFVLIPYAIRSTLEIWAASIGKGNNKRRDLKI